MLGSRTAARGPNGDPRRPQLAQPRADFSGHTAGPPRPPAQVRALPASSKNDRAARQPRRAAPPRPPTSRSAQACRTVEEKLVIAKRSLGVPLNHDLGQTTPRPTTAAGPFFDSQGLPGAPTTIGGRSASPRHRKNALLETRATPAARGERIQRAFPASVANRRALQWQGGPSPPNATTRGLAVALPGPPTPNSGRQREGRRNAAQNATGWSKEKLRLGVRRGHNARLPITSPPGHQDVQGRLQLISNTICAFDPLARA
eukprot:5119421-Lingulodinium_polyedra.AAC.1